MSWLLKVAICIATALTVALVSTVSANALGIEISGSFGARMAYSAVEMLLAWCVLLVPLKLNRMKTTQPD